MSVIFIDMRFYFGYIYCKNMLFFVVINMFL